MMETEQMAELYNYGGAGGASREYIKTPSDGVWMAYYAGSDGGPGIPFRTEVEALRHAISFGMQVKFARFGDEDWTKDGHPIPKPDNHPVTR